MIADALAYAGPIQQILDLLSAEKFVPEPARDVMRPVSDGLEVAQRLGPPLERLLSETWDSLASLGAAHSVAEIGRTVGALTESAVEIARVTAVAADIVVRGTIEVIGIVQQFIARAAALGPTLMTPPGQVALLGLATEHLARGIQVAERVQLELKGPTLELRAIAAGIPDAPGVPGGITDSSTGGAINASTAAHTGSGPGSLGSSGTASAGGISPSSAAYPGGAGDPGGAGGSASGAGESAGAGAGVLGGGVDVVLPDGSVATAPNEQAAGAVRNALSQQGVPYVWGGTTPGQGLDCSGLTQWAYRDAGVEIPRLAQEQGVGAQVSRSDLMPGDLAVWDGHVAMYIGNGQLVEAGDPVSVSGLRTDNIGMSFYGFYRPTGG
ncbi:C40 family peptidase [Dietzia natronolimnaea]|uniref:C40 family peptidase n=2 Tax=Dietzia natronolimnaea TaxID=161920 RepID=UPI0031F94399